ncbi:MAG: tRNA epoxyqueuosine(34) reductase QueG [Bacteroidales bacterium]|jgi:epoxyqueuosine reductase|nr:tRNA epoxyqueuosine(34) reductase QueG [Bacteroidales bacterium]
MFSQQIKDKALEIGFSACGITSAEDLPSERKIIFRQWLQNGFHGDMHYLQRNLDKRMSPQLLLEGVKSIIVVLLNYHNPMYHKKKRSVYTVAEYALGCDYHIVMRDKLRKLSDFIQGYSSEIQSRSFVDTAPVLEKYLACKAGLGTLGKNTLLLTKKGSYFFIGEIYTTVSLRYDTSFLQDCCSFCKQCIKACPVQALETPYCLDTNKCLAYHTIENKNNIPKEIQTKIDKHIYGCDICQQVCPYNKEAEVTKVKEFSIKPEFLQWDDFAWENMDKDTFERVFADSALYRIGYTKLMQTIALASK